MINVLEDAAKEAGKILLTYFQKELVVKEKTSQHNIVTEADIAAQNHIKESLLAGALKQGLKESDIGFIGEEEGMNSQAKYTFVIDPLDGTSNFAAGLDIFGVTIALLDGGKVTHGVIYLPSKDQLYSAERGKGAHLTTQKGREKLTIQPVELSKKLIVETATSDIARQSYFKEAASKLTPLFMGRRVFGCGVYEATQLLTNVLGAVFAYGPRLWDIAATKLLVEEAGGVMMDLEGHDLVLYIDEPDTPHKFVACHPKNLPTILEALKS